ncbi:hypothetical protein ACFZB6_27095 [Streptomyces syringium]|uniref:hypothetical protein n=1 Tax=Streptomyces syringium TaxID=76729 RepID=UPI0033B1FAFA
MTSPLHRGCDHFALRAVDFAATVRFTTEALGVTVAYACASSGVVGRSADR